jgi:hypothetical protein
VDCVEAEVIKEREEKKDWFGEDDKEYCIHRCWFKRWSSDQ